MFHDLENKRVLSTGSTAGMGLATARLLTSYGAQVGLNNHVDSKSNEAVEEAKALGSDADCFYGGHHQVGRVQKTRRGLCAAFRRAGHPDQRRGGTCRAGIYAGAKEWLHDVHRNWVMESTEDKFRFNIISPGSIATALHSDMTEHIPGVNGGQLAP